MPKSSVFIDIAVKIVEEITAINIKFLFIVILNNADNSGIKTIGRVMSAVYIIISSIEVAKTAIIIAKTPKISAENLANGSKFFDKIFKGLKISFAIMTEHELIVEAAVAKDIAIIPTASNPRRPS